VFLRVVDCWLLFPFGVISNLKFASAFRVFQFGRAVRQVQLHPNFRELWIVISAVGETMWRLVSRQQWPRDVNTGIRGWPYKNWKLPRRPTIDMTL
ncbi:Sodium channel protein type 11 subunit alpha, partial [Durusdinium trenchii]